MGGHTHDGMPVATLVNNKGGKTIVTNAGSNGKFLGVLDFEVKNKKIMDFRYKLLPIFSNMLPADKEMDALINKIRAPFETKLNETLAITEGTLYRRGNFNGTGDQLLLDALMDVQGADMAFSPGFRWGTSLLPGQAITREWLMDMTATTYSYATVSELTGETIKTILEDVCDNLFNPDPYYQQGGDMVAAALVRCASKANSLTPTRNTKWQAGHPWLKKQKTKTSSPCGKWPSSGSKPAAAKCLSANSTRLSLKACCPTPALLLSKSFKNRND
jgi:2',3'-cyclic-nucleotide 2'-phosphodiesterase (5'-nucleotidase family)